MHNQFRARRRLTIGSAALSCVILACSGSPSGPVTTTQRTPPPSAGHELVYHDGLHAVLLVNSGLGGTDDASKAGQKTKLWAWRGQAWELVDSLGPPIRNLGGVTYDKRRNVLVLYGGTFSETLSYDDTWEWSSSGWRRIDIPGPGIRHHTQMVFDEARGKVVLASGQANGLTFPADVWTYDGVQWTRLANDNGVRRIHHALVYDAVRQKTMLISGVDPGVRDTGETLELENNVWRANATLAMSARSLARAVFVASTGTIMVVGGFSNGTLSNDVLMSTAQGWQPQSGTRPPARYLTGLAYDPERHVVVLFGGGNNSSLLNDTWEWDGSTWRQR